MTVFIDGKPEEYPLESSYREIAAAHQKAVDCPIVLVRENGRLRELAGRARDGAQIQFVTVKDQAGRDTWRRSLVLLMLKSMYHIVGDNANIDRVGVHFSVGNSYYCTMEGKTVLTQAFLDEVKQYMHALADAAVPIQKSSISTAEACRRFHEYRMYDKEELFRYRISSRVNIYSLETFEDYFYGYMLPDTSCLTCFDLRLFEDGFLLCFPSEKEMEGIRPAGSPEERLSDQPASLPEFTPEQHIWQAQKDALEWGRRLGIPTVGALNSYIVQHSTKDLILVQEAYQEKKIAELAEQIAVSGKRVVLIAGPSSSGKTTFSHRLATQLAVHGLKPHPIEADNYFVEREFAPLDEEGKPDFECLEAIDLEQLNADMAALLEGSSVQMPTYNFKTGKREYKGNTECLGPDDILIIEGIHCLNDQLTYRINADQKFKIYISALTELNIDKHNRIPTTDGRLIRRMVRDARVRGMGAKQTIDMWPSVRRGEESHIFPFQETADFTFNSALIYELAVLKQYAQPLLFSVQPEDPAYEEAKRLLKFLDYFLPIPSEDVPNNSLIREFIGGGCYEG